MQYGKLQSAYFALTLALTLHWFGRGVFSDAAPEVTGTNYTKGATDWRYVQQVHPQVPSREPAVPHLRVGCPTARWLTGTRVLGVQRDLALVFDGADWRTGEAQSEVGRDDRPLSSIPRRARINTSAFPEAGDTSWREADCAPDYCDSRSFISCPSEDLAMGDRGLEYVRIHHWSCLAHPPQPSARFNSLWAGCYPPQWVCICSLPPVPIQTNISVPTRSKLGKGWLKYDALILTDTGAWLPPEPGFPNLDALMIGASLDIIKIQQARLAQRSMGTACTLLPAALMEAVIRVLPADAVPAAISRRAGEGGSVADT